MFTAIYGYIVLTAAGCLAFALLGTRGKRGADHGSAPAGEMKQAA